MEDMGKLEDDLVDEDVDEVEEGNTMMSIFANYYGIEDESSKHKLSIDSPQFDADQYVQVRGHITLGVLSLA